MSNRNMIEISDAMTGKVNSNYDMTIAEMNKLREIYLEEGLPLFAWDIIFPDCT